MTDRPTSEQPLDDLDAAVLDRFRAALQVVDPMPPDLDERVELALTVQALNAEIAELQRVPEDLAGVRSHDYERVDTVTFTGGTMSAVVTISRVDSETARIDGWVDGDLAEVELRERSRTSSVSIDAEGRFAFARVERGLVQFVFRSPGAETSTVITPSMEV
jgi:hypothetical protein